MGSNLSGFDFDLQAGERYLPTKGYQACVSFGLHAFRTGAGLTLPAAGSGIVGVGLVATSLLAARWDDTADDADTVALMGR